MCFNCSALGGNAVIWECRSGHLRQPGRRQLLCTCWRWGWLVLTRSFPESKSQVFMLHSPSRCVLDYVVPDTEGSGGEEGRGETQNDFDSLYPLQNLTDTGMFVCCCCLCIQCIVLWGLSVWWARVVPVKIFLSIRWGVLWEHGYLTVRSGSQRYRERHQHTRGRRWEKERKYERGWRTKEHVAVGPLVLEWIGRET